MKFNRIIVIVTDSVGAGDAPDAEKFGDKGADTYGHIDANVPLKVPNLRRLGLAGAFAGGLKWSRVDRAHP